MLQGRDFKKLISAQKTVFLQGMQSYIKKFINNNYRYAKSFTA